MTSVSGVGERHAFLTVVGDDTYIVKRGDTLWDIAREHGISLAELIAANPQIANPDYILPDQHINLPPGATPPVSTASNGSGGVHAQAASYHGGSPPAALQGRIDQAMRFFESQGWTRAQAAGIVANLQAESRLENGIQQTGGGPGYGLAQWEGPRQAAFRQWAGHDIHGSSFDEQLRFIQYELTHSESGAGNALRRATSAGDAAEIVTRLYERPRDTAGQSVYRAGLARQIFGSSAP